MVIELNQDDNKSQVSQKSKKLDPIKKTISTNITNNNILLGRNKDLIDLSEKSSVHSKKLAPLKQTSTGVGVDYSDLLNVARIEGVKKSSNFYDFESSNFLEDFKTQKKIELTSIDQMNKNLGINTSNINSYFKSDKLREEENDKKLSTNKKSNFLLSSILFSDKNVQKQLQEDHAKEEIHFNQIIEKQFKQEFWQVYDFMEKTGLDKFTDNVIKEGITTIDKILGKFLL